METALLDHKSQQQKRQSAAFSLTRSIWQIPTLVAAGISRRSTSRFVATCCILVCLIRDRAIAPRYFILLQTNGQHLCVLFIGRAVLIQIIANPLHLTRNKSARSINAKSHGCSGDKLDHALFPKESFSRFHRTNG